MQLNVKAVRRKFLLHTFTGVHFQRWGALADIDCAQSVAMVRCCGASGEKELEGTRRHRPCSQGAWNLSHVLLLPLTPLVFTSFVQLGPTNSVVLDTVRAALFSSISKVGAFPGQSRGSDTGLSLPWPRFSPCSGNWDPANCSAQSAIKIKSALQATNHKWRPIPCRLFPASVSVSLSLIQLGIGEAHPPVVYVVSLLWMTWM